MFTNEDVLLRQIPIITLFNHCLSDIETKKYLKYLLTLHNMIQRLTLNDTETMCLVNQKISILLYKHSKIKCPFVIIKLLKIHL